MKKYKIFLLVVLPGFVTLIYLSCNEAKVSREPLSYPILNSRIARTVDDIKPESQKLVSNSELVIICQFVIPEAGNQTKGNASSIFCGVSIQDGNLTIGSRVIDEGITISKAVSTKKRILNCFSRIVICKGSSGSLKYKFHFSF